jgi:hypothetical protein
MILQEETRRRRRTEEQTGQGGQGANAKWHWQLSRPPLARDWCCAAAQYVAGDGRSISCRLPRLLRCPLPACRFFRDSRRITSMSLQRCTSQRSPPYPSTRTAQTQKTAGFPFHFPVIDPPTWAEWRIPSCHRGKGKNQHDD